MDIKEVQDKKAKMQEDISKIISDFISETGLFVTDVSLTMYNCDGGESVLLSVHCNVNL